MFDINQTTNDKNNTALERKTFVALIRNKESSYSVKTFIFDDSFLLMEYFTLKHSLLY